MSEYRNLIDAACPGAVIDEFEGPGDELTIEIAAARIREVCLFLKSEPAAFRQLSDLTCVDVLEGNGDGGRFRLRCRVGQNPDLKLLEQILPPRINLGGIKPMAACNGADTPALCNNRSLQAREYLEPLKPPCSQDHRQRLS